MRMLSATYMLVSAFPVCLKSAMQLSNSWSASSMVPNSIFTSPMFMVKFASASTSPFFRANSMPSFMYFMASTY